MICQARLIVITEHSEPSRFLAVFGRRRLGNPRPWLRRQAGANTTTPFCRVLNGLFMALTPVLMTIGLRHFTLKTKIIMPRQARDKHREQHSKKTLFPQDGTKGRQPRGTTVEGKQNGFSLSLFVLKRIILPRQARANMGKAAKEVVFRRVHYV
jgi:hypothetical protein